MAMFDRSTALVKLSQEILVQKASIGARCVYKQTAEARPALANSRIPGMMSHEKHVEEGKNEEIFS
jgi:hypothetical protein